MFKELEGQAQYSTNSEPDNRRKPINQHSHSSSQVVPNWGREVIIFRSCTLHAHNFFAHPTHTCPEVHSRRAVLLVCAPDAQLAVCVVAPALDATAGYHRARVFIAQADGRGRNT
jgi:hypothetical protein